VHIGSGRENFRRILDPALRIHADDLQVIDLIEKSRADSTALIPGSEASTLMNLFRVVSHEINFQSRRSTLRRKELQPKVAPSPD
jgi:hypothetical protein